MPKHQSQWELLADHVHANYPGTSMGSNAHGLVTNVTNEEQTQEEFDAMMADLQARFPGAFHAVVNEEPPTPPPPKPTKDCPFCGETILAVAKKCRHCFSYMPVE